MAVSPAQDLPVSSMPGFENERARRRRQDVWECFHLKEKKGLQTNKKDWVK